ncbi:unnamed protein product [Coffea canephora]|uniref:NB-ARC domain-containing protein n=1 Tax=Coffea canephora TaxID=49390 RepID=A0A068VHU5_COFCA|nr:unnamed protein product [Coffea canephora]
MAELTVPKIIDQLSDALMKQLGEKVNLVMGVEEEVANISSKLATIEKVLHDAKRRRLKDRSVGIWLEKLEDITYEMDDVLDEWNFKIHRAKNEGTNQNARLQPTLWNKVPQKIKKINEQLELTLKEADQFKFISSVGIPDSQDFKRIMTTSIIDESEIYGRESDKDALLDQVLSKSSSQGRDGVQIISIVGAGGSGKTTLAQLLFNDDRVKNHFELKKMDLQTFSGKRFLLVLDDVWTKEHSKWKPFQYFLKDGTPGSVILVTTRSLEVARAVGTTHTHLMALMSDSDCWQIVRRIAFGGRSEEWRKKRESIGQKIAEKCKGLPLALKTMGSLLRLKDTVQQWQNVLDSESLELVGLEYFNNLAMRSFFQELEKVEAYYGLTEYMKCKMHDIVHDFAQFLTKNECHALDGTGRNSSSERPRHLTILEEGTEEEMFSSRVVDFGRLRSFLTFHRFERVVPQNLDNPFITLPEAICDLYYLETLNINDCGQLSCLPERIEGLVHLRHLFSEDTDDLGQIPQGLRKLTSLCTLTGFIARSNFDDLAILKDLNQLERLVIKIKREIDFGSAKLDKKINMHEMFLLLEQLALVGYPGAQLPSWLVTKSHANNLTRLIISGPRNISSLHALWKLSSLEELKLGEAEKLECLGKEFFGSSFSAEAVAFPNLRKLHFRRFQNWTNWEELSEDDEEVTVSIMPRLEKLKISQCYKLEALRHRILSKISSLKNLDIQYCYKLRNHYSDKTGDGWKKISHISQVHISDY